MQGKDTIEKIQIRHIKGMTMVEQLGDKDKQKEGDAGLGGGEEEFDRKIRKDLENDDDFAALLEGFAGEQLASSEAVDEESKNKDTEWIESSQSETELEQPSVPDSKTKSNFDAS